MNSAMSAALVCHSQAIRASQQTATLPLLVAAPLTPRRLVTLSAGYPLLRASLEGALYLLAGVWLGVTLQGASLAGALLVFAVSLCAFSAIGMLSAACTVVWKRGDPIPWLFDAASWLLGGVFFPVDLLPAPLQAVSRLLPITYALEAIRPALLTPAGLGQIFRLAMPLIVFAAAAPPLAFLAFGRSSTSLLQFDGSGLEGGGMAGSSRPFPPSTTSSRQPASGFQKRLLKLPYTRSAAPM